MSEEINDDRRRFLATAAATVAAAQLGLARASAPLTAAGLRGAGTDAREEAESQQVVENACPGRGTLDQESPGWPQKAAFGSSPEGRLDGPTLLSWCRAFSLVRPAATVLLPFLPHSEVAESFQSRARDYDGWLRGMSRLQ